MIKLNLHQVKIQLSKYIEMVEAGETIVVCKRNVPVAEIRAIGSKERQAPILGSAAGKTRVHAAGLEPMPPEELRLLESGDKEDPLKKYAPRPKARRR